MEISTLLLWTSYALNMIKNHNNLQEKKKDPNHVAILHQLWVSEWAELTGLHAWLPPCFWA